MKLREGDLKEAREELLSLWKGIVEAWEKDAFPAKPGKLCEWCSFKTICPAWNFVREEEQGVQGTGEGGREEGATMTTVMDMAGVEGREEGRKEGRVLRAGGDGE